MTSELHEIHSRYQRRAGRDVSAVYSPLKPANYMAAQERERAIIRCIVACGLQPVAEKSILEVGCGAGEVLQQLLRLGFRPENLVGNELLPEKAQIAIDRLPKSLRIVVGDARTIDIPEKSFDIVLQSTVFTSILSDEFQQQLADLMWRFVKPGGGVMWYDFVYDNPSNKDVRGVSLARLKALFPQGKFAYVRRITLAPPIGRRVTQLHPCLYTVFNVLPFLRTHILCYIQKPER